MVSSAAVLLAMSLMVLTTASGNVSATVHTQTLTHTQTSRSTPHGSSV